MKTEIRRRAFDVAPRMTDIERDELLEMLSDLLDLSCRTPPAKPPTMERVLHFINLISEALPVSGVYLGTSGMKGMDR